MKKAFAVSVMLALFAAKTIFGRVEQVLPNKIKAQKAVVATFASEEVCARQLAFTVYDYLRVTQTNFEIISKKQPFINQAYHKEAVDFWRQKLERLKISINPEALAEEKHLFGIFGEQYAEYTKRVPRFWFSLRNFYTPETIEVSAKSIYRVTREAMLILTVPVIGKLIEILHANGSLPILWTY